MTRRELAIFLVEELADANINKKVAVFVNRLMLRLNSQPALLSSLHDVTVFKPGVKAETTDQVEDGQFQEDCSDDKKKKDDRDPNEAVIVQLSFKRLPQEIVPALIRLIAAPREPQLFRYTKDGSARTGIEIELTPSDFPGDDYDYAF